MSAQPSDGAFDVASKWQGHRFNCAIYGDHELPDTACSCIVRELASAIDALVAEAVAAERERCARIAYEIGQREWRLAVRAGEYGNVQRASNFREGGGTAIDIEAAIRAAKEQAPPPLPSGDEKEK